MMSPLIDNRAGIGQDRLRQQAVGKGFKRAFETYVRLSNLSSDDAPAFTGSLDQIAIGAWGERFEV
ncbi:hypothetical protein BGP77_16465 [Saccharospirillum sp. MSK14-1]|nr:hypothetical protein BGP77_16465 [Saccharospirillum sp. MSK14-1]